MKILVWQQYGKSVVYSADSQEDVSAISKMVRDILEDWGFDCPWKDATVKAGELERSVKRMGSDHESFEIFEFVEAQKP